MKSILGQYKYKNDKGRTVAGTAAQLHFFAENGGVDHVLEEIAKEAGELAIRKFLKKMSKGTRT